MRIGTGYDVHRLVPERDLILGGVKVPYQKGLLGHSDADVVLHAIMDAILGACALGDIGKLFPDTDAQFKGASSLHLTKAVAAVVEKAGFRIVNVDATVIAQAPKLRPYIDQMREETAKALGIPVDCVSIKATTEEGLGFTGAGDGIATQAVALVEEKSN